MNLASSSTTSTTASTLGCHLTKFQVYLTTTWSHYYQQQPNSLVTSSGSPDERERSILQLREDLRSSFNLIPSLPKSESTLVNSLMVGSILKYWPSDEFHKKGHQIWKLMEGVIDNSLEGLIGYFNQCSHQLVFDNLTKLYPPNELTINSALPQTFLPLGCELLMKIYTRCLTTQLPLTDNKRLKLNVTVVDLPSISFVYLLRSLELIKLTTGSSSDSWVRLLNHINYKLIPRYRQMLNQVSLFDRNQLRPITQELIKHIRSLDDIIQLLKPLSGTELSIYVLESQLQSIKDELQNTTELSTSSELPTGPLLNSNLIKFQKESELIPMASIPQCLQGKPETKLTREEAHQLITFYNQGGGIPWDPLQIKLRNYILSKRLNWGDNLYLEIDAKLIATTNQAVHPPHHDINVKLVSELNILTLIQPHQVILHLILLAVERPHLATTYCYFIHQLQLDGLVTGVNDEPSSIELNKVTPVLVKGYFQALNDPSMLAWEPHWVRVTLALMDLNKEFLGDVFTYIFHQMLQSLLSNLNTPPLPDTLWSTVKLILTIISQLPSSAWVATSMISLVGSKLFSSIMYLSQLYHHPTMFNNNLLIINTIKKLVAFIMNSISELSHRNLSPVNRPQFIRILQSLRTTILTTATSDDEVMEVIRPILELTLV